MLHNWRVNYFEVIVFDGGFQCFIETIFIVNEVLFLTLCCRQQKTVWTINGSHQFHIHPSVRCIDVKWLIIGFARHLILRDVLIYCKIDFLYSPLPIPPSLTRCIFHSEKKKYYSKNNFSILFQLVYMQSFYKICRSLFSKFFF